MYYIELIDRFWLFTEKTKPGTAAISLYLYLLQIAKEKNAYQFLISDIELGKRMGLSRATIKTTRDKLSKFGLIEYHNARGVAGIYKLIVNYPLEPVFSERVQTDPASEITDFIEKNDNVLEILEVGKTDNSSASGDKSIPFESSNLLICGRAVPSLQDFLEYARTLDAYHPELDDLIMAKYSGWLKSNWISASGRPITNWQSSLKNVLPFITSEVAPNKLTVDNIPEIRHPKVQE